MAGIYIHIPFCKQACHYCDFHFSTNASNLAEMVTSIALELELQKGYLTDRIDTIYFGGGTPSILPHDSLENLMAVIYRNFEVAADAEITLEANPDDLSAEKLSLLKNAGINRLSIGIQAFNDQILKFFNRAHSAIEALTCVNMAREAGFNNISIDLIYGVPDQSHAEWLRNVSEALNLAPEHISAYALTIEPGTAFGIWQKRGKLKAVEEEFAAEQLEILITELEKAGYEQYEVSNFSKPGFQSRHNSSYWKQTYYLGVGPSAHSYNGVSRQFNISNNSLYLKSMAQGKIPFELESLSVEDHANEYLLTTLRTIWGTDLTLLKNKFGYDLINEHPEYITLLVEQKHAVIENQILKLTRSGKLLADKISSDLFMEKPPGLT